MTPDHRDLVIADLADAEAALRDYVASLEADVGVYRELAIAGFDALRDLTMRLDRMTADRNMWRDEARRLREDHLLRAGADEAA